MDTKKLKERLNLQKSRLCEGEQSEISDLKFTIGSLLQKRQNTQWANCASSLRQSGSRVQTVEASSPPPTGASTINDCDTSSASAHKFNLHCSKDSTARRQISLVKKQGDGGLKSARQSIGKLLDDHLSIQQQLD
mmetsp:Transcript_3169/g.5290  ORF Transcript_3169/g.5290 Transcript_3169/m.5290 type:complete len:135 (+) Transcript_3169:449-853(+)